MYIAPRPLHEYAYTFSWKLPQFCCFEKDPSCFPNLLQIINPSFSCSLAWLCLLTWHTPRQTRFEGSKCSSFRYLHCSSPLLFFIFVYLFIFENFKNFNTVQSSVRGSFQLLHGQTGGQGLLQLLCLLFVCDDQGVKVSAASNFKLHIILIFLDLDRLGVLAAGREQEVLDFLNFARDSHKARGAKPERQGARSERSEKALLFIKNSFIEIQFTYVFGECHLPCQ